MDSLNLKNHREARDIPSSWHYLLHIDALSLGALQRESTRVAAAVMLLHDFHDNCMEPAELLSY